MSYAFIGQLITCYVLGWIVGGLFLWMHKLAEAAVTE